LWGFSESFSIDGSRGGGIDYNYGEEEKEGEEEMWR
jgi:hypothetical protein